MVDVDAPPGKRRAGLRRHNLHVARQHQKLRPLLLHQSQKRSLRLRLAVRLDRDEMIRHAPPCDGGPQNLVVGDHRGDVRLQPAGLLLVQQIVQAMPEPRHRNHDLGPRHCVMDAPTHPEPTTDGRKPRFQLRRRRPFSAWGRERRPHEEPVRGRVMELVAFLDGKAPISEERRHRRDDAHRVRAFQDEDKAAESRGAGRGCQKRGSNSCVDLKTGGSMTHAASAYTAWRHRLWCRRCWICSPTSG
jgi:hypothetical protein